MTVKPIGTKLVIKYHSGKSFSYSGIKNGLGNSDFFNTAAAINMLQEDSAKYIYKVEDTELTDESA